MGPSIEELIIGALVGGFVVGLIPLILGLKFKQTGMAVGSFIATIIGSCILGIFLSIPICVISSIIIISRGDQTPKVSYQPQQNIGFNQPNPFQNSSQNQGSNFCPNCGNQLNPNSHFCSKCGNRV